MTKNSIDEYSAKEIQLFNAIGYDFISKIDFNPPSLYSMAARKMFEEDRHDAIADSIRRCSVALSRCKVYRGTQEWDDLIQFEYDYSQKEIEFFNLIGWETKELLQTEPIEAYKLAAMRRFMANQNDDISNILRKCLNSLFKTTRNSIERNTIEWDCLISADVF